MAFQQEPRKDPKYSLDEIRYLTSRNKVNHHLQTERKLTNVFNRGKGSTLINAKTSFLWVEISFYTYGYPDQTIHYQPNLIWARTTTVNNSAWKSDNFPCGVFQSIVEVFPKKDACLWSHSTLKSFVEVNMRAFANQSGKQLRNDIVLQGGIITKHWRIHCQEEMTPTWTRW